MQERLDNTETLWEAKAQYDKSANQIQDTYDLTRNFPQLTALEVNYITNPFGNKDFKAFIQSNHYRYYVAKKS